MTLRNFKNENTALIETVLPKVEDRVLAFVRDVVLVLLKASEIFPAETKYLEAATRGCQFLLNVQGNGGSSSQLGWAQQYDDNNQPAWARDFEPPAISSRATV